MTKKQLQNASGSEGSWLRGAAFVCAQRRNSLVPGGEEPGGQAVLQADGRADPEHHVGYWATLAL